MSQFWLFHPRGPIAQAGFQSILVDVAAMMIIIGPTTLLLLWCIWRYRRSTSKAPYTPGWSHSLPVEIVSWGFPLAIVGFLSYYTYISTYAVDPFNPRLMAAGTSADADRAPIDVDVVSTDWQWLFIYPGRHIAASNELVVPVRTPVRFRLTSATVPNDLFIPQLVGEIDIMPGMLTKQALIANRPGTYEGIAADYSGPGFSWMQFKTHVVPRADFDRWVGMVSRSPLHLDQAAFDSFAVPTINSSGRRTYFSDVDPGLFGRIIQNVMAGKVYPTPSLYTEKKASYQNGRRQPGTDAALSHSEPGMSN